MSVLKTIWDGIQALFLAIVNFVVTIIKGILNFYKQVVSYFKNLQLDPKKDTPFILDGQKLGELVHNAPRVDCGIFEATYNEETEKIEHYREIQADELDKETKEILKKNKEDGLVVLQ